MTEKQLLKLIEKLSKRLTKVEEGFKDLRYDLDSIDKALTELDENVTNRSKYV